MVDVAEIKIWGEFAGAVRWDEREQLGYFQYDKKFLQKGWDLSPIKMPLLSGTQIYSFPELRKSRSDIENTFKGLPGMLADVLPDRYGNRLINTWLVHQGRAENSMNPVEMLCFIGTRGMGALEFEQSHVSNDSKHFSIEIDSLVEIAARILNEREKFSTNLSKDEKQALLSILKIGTSAGGARPKALIAFNPQTNEVRSGQGKVPRGYEHWLLKLDGVSGEQFGESLGWGRVEYAYYLMAQDAGIEMTTSSLLEENGRAHFMTKRYDRDGNTRHHVQTLCGIQHYDFNDMYGYSYEQVFQTMRMLRLNYPEAEQMFRRMTFNVLASNYDDHTKNFSFILKQNEAWRLAPAYDVCYAYDPNNHWVNKQTLSINGKREKINKADIIILAKINNIKKAEKIYDEIFAVVKDWKKYAGKAGVRSDLTKVINNNILRIGA